MVALPMWPFPHIPRNILLFFFPSLGLHCYMGFGGLVVVGTALTSRAKDLVSLCNSGHKEGTSQSWDGGSCTTTIYYTDNNGSPSS